MDTAVAAVQADVDQNETDADSAIALRRLVSESYTKVEVDAAVAAVQADVDLYVNYADSAIGLSGIFSYSYTKLEVDAKVITTAERTKVGFVDVSSGITGLLATKQGVIGNDHLSISHTSGLQTALDAHPALDTSVLYHHSANGGRVGIGTANPAKVLHVHADSAPSGDLARFSSNGGYNIQFISGTGANEKNFQMTHIGSAFQNYYAGTLVAQYDANGVTFPNGFQVTKAAPSTATSAGTAGEIRVDANYVYFCTATNVWKRLANGAAW